MQTDIETHITEKIICEDCNPGFVADIVMPFGIRDANNTIDIKMQFSYSDYSHKYVSSIDC